MDSIQKEPYFYDDISREESEIVLWDRGCLNGMYLLRSSQNKDAAFVLSLCFDKSVHHYRIKQSIDNLFYVHGATSEKFSSLMELIKNIDGLICQPSIACNKPLNKLIRHNFPLSENNIKIAIENKAKEWGLEESILKSALDGKNNELYTVLMKTLHEPQPWFHGKISRPEAEQQLQKSGHVDGKFLIRERNDCSYALCLSYGGETKHYKIDVTSTGEFRIQDGPRFENLLQLVSHYTELYDGLWCCLKEPCPKHNENDEAEISKCGQQKLEEITNNSSPTSKNPPCVARRKSPAPPPPLTKPNMNRTSQVQDQCLPSPVRTLSDPSGSPKSEQLFEKLPETKETKTSCNNVSSDKSLLSFFSKNSPPIVEENNKGAVKVKTKKPLISFKIRDSDKQKEKNKKGDNKNEIENSGKPISPHSNGKSIPDLSPVIKELQQQLSVHDDSVTTKNNMDTPKEDSNVNNDEPVYQVIDPEYESNLCNEEQAGLHNLAVSDLDLNSSLISAEIKKSKWDEGAENKKEFKRLISITRKPTWTKEESEKHFRTIRKFRKNPMNIHSKNIILKEKLGAGNFGEVYKAYFKSENIEVPFAVKMLKSTIASAKSEMLQEARLMTGLDHTNIVRLIGICEDNTIMLVMELAPLGPLNLYLKSHSDTHIADVLQIMLQVASGMEYLEGRQFVHRDLAARNVLLVNENFAKISDFGMSKALGLDQDYYRMQPSGKLPLKWYAPECIYFFKFSSKSDIWSYGITLWEALSYGEKPYLGMTGQEILKMFSENKRLEKPRSCPNVVYDIMLKCWRDSPEDRPAFGQVYSLLQNFVDKNSI